ncbi:MAG: mechanosensitive ion channel family protein, partial [Deferribacterales bacterium]
ISFSKIPEHYTALILKIISIIIVISVTLAVANLISSIFTQYLRESQVAIPNTGLFQALIKSTIYIIGVLIILNRLGIAIAPLITALGVGGLAVALALKDTLSNLFSGVHIMVERAIKVGDFIMLENGVEGFVDDITWRTTRIKTVQNNFVIVPNEKMVQSIITNFDLNDQKLAVPINVSVSYDSDIDHVEKVLLEVAKKCMDEMDGFAKDSEPIVRFMPGFGESSVDFTLIVFADQIKSRPVIQSAINKEIFKRFRTENIEIPYPQRVIHMKQ